MNLFLPRLRELLASVHKERQKQNEIFSHTPHLLFTGGLLTAFEDLPLLLNCIISQQIELVNEKGASSLEVPFCGVGRSFFRVRFLVTIARRARG